MEKKKKGIPYEKVVAEILASLDPGASVEQGQWENGPDGYRELDVRIKGYFKGHEYKVLVECKDFNPQSTGPVGIQYVDALESKLRDLGYNRGIICSNAGFTQNAIKKAGRVGIGLISVMKKADSRIKYLVSEEIYTRVVKVEKLQFTFEGPSLLKIADFSISDIFYKKESIENWVNGIVMKLIGSNPIVSGEFRIILACNRDLILTTPEGNIVVTRLIINLNLSGVWLAQQVTLDATSGIFNWFHHRTILSPQENQLHIQGVNLYEGKVILKPPQRILDGILNLDEGEVDFAIVIVNGLGEPNKSGSEIDSYIRSEDLDMRIKDIDEKCYTSDNDFQIPVDSNKHHKKQDIEL